MTKRILSVAFVVALLATFLPADSANAQCNVIITRCSTPTPAFRDCTKRFATTQAGPCVVVSSNNVFGCFPYGLSGAPNGVRAAVNLPAATNPFCQWSCPCGPVRVDGSDGLPVELLEFEVVDGKDTENATDEKTTESNKGKEGKKDELDEKSVKDKGKAKLKKKDTKRK